MTTVPPFFEPIRRHAEQRWAQLENDAELAGPWHLLFKQVQSPRHVLSELLQNADDAGATEASVRIEDHYFIFTHNGEDFTEAHFASICRFGYSNKRSLHTIGFRGIGFKSTFSLGDTVELTTPSLSVAFDRHRFTAPRWRNTSSTRSSLTEIRVRIRDTHRELEVQKNLQDWKRSAVSLLFFRHIRRLQIGDHGITWSSMGPGPVPDSEWMAFNGDPDEAFLVVRSRPEPFPQEALDEIRQERMGGLDQETEFPLCKVEIVLGAKGRLYVVLPTGVETKLPFACNAPFIQDPARIMISNPVTSPTNRWLLERIGKLACDALFQWLGDGSISLEERSQAYGLFPDVDRQDSSLEGVCATIVEAIFDGPVKNQPFLLTDAGDLKPSQQAVIVPEELFEVWPPDQVADLLDGGRRPILCTHISREDRDKLVLKNLVTRITKDKVLDILQSKLRLPKPGTWLRLLKLWAYAAPEITGWRLAQYRASFRIIPVQGKDVLYSANEVVRLGDKKLLQAEEDWDFLSQHLLVMNPNWPRFLAERRRMAAENREEASDSDNAAAEVLMRLLGLENSSDVSEVIERVAGTYFSEGARPIADCVRIAQIGAKLGVTAKDSFRFVTRDRSLRSRAHVVLADRDGTLEDLLPEPWVTQHMLHPEYGQNFGSCSADEWYRWVSSGRAGLHEFVPMSQRRQTVLGKADIEAAICNRGWDGRLDYYYKTETFVLEDWDFGEELWAHWATLAKEDDKVWGHVVERILTLPASSWTMAKSARVLHVATTSSLRDITDQPIVPAWILRLRDLPCLRDTRGFYHKPSELLRRTPENESLIDVEPFVHRSLDGDGTAQLLVLLGVRDAPAGPDRMLSCLRALALADNPPIAEVEKWYRRLDKLLDTCSTEDFAKIRGAFTEEKIVFTEASEWATASGVYLSSDEQDVPGAPIIRATVRDLTLWHKVGVADRPSADLAMQWLMGLSSGSPLATEDARRVKALLARHPRRIWEECGHWVNLAGEWAETSSLTYALTMQSLVPWGNLHEWVKQRTADLQRLPVEVSSAPPFSDLTPLSACLENRFHRDPLLNAEPERKAWIEALGQELSRVEVETNEETSHARTLARDLAQTMWQKAPGVEVVPYIDGVPAGTPRYTDLIWLERVLYVDDLSKARLAKRVPEELGRVFGRPDLKSVFDYSFERSPEDIRAYLQENFRLSTRPDLPVGENETVAEKIHVVSGIGTAQETGVPIEDAADNQAGLVGPGPEDDLVSHDERHDEIGSAPTGDDGAVAEGNSSGTPSKTRHEQHPPKPSVMERFALSLGFRKDGDDRFFHADGGWIGRTSDMPFPWEHRTSAGDLIRYYWAKDHCLDRGALQLEADIWGLLEKFPDTYSLVLCDHQDNPAEMTGASLRKLRHDEKLKLYPASYRLVVKRA